jgi:SAM-dependent methyltransferase
MNRFTDVIRQARKTARLVKFRLEHRGKAVFTCPICRYRGPFEDVDRIAALRKHALCPSCGALERHRLQFLVLNEILERIDPAGLTMLHFAPEKFFRAFFSERFGRYETADLAMKGVDHRVDLEVLPFANATYDFVFASHVLEHIRNDDRAIREIRRVLRPNGIAVLPVPLVCEKTIEYPAPNPNETNHVRAPGLDYFDKYERVFSRVEKFTSESFPAMYQLFVYEDRSRWPTPECPLRPPMQGEKHIDITPVCYV